MLGAIVDEASRRFGGRNVVVAPDGTMTYSELAERSRWLANGLAQRGISQGDVVVLAMHSGCNWLVAAVASDRVGAAFAGISPVLTATERAMLHRLIGPRLTIASPDLADGLPLRHDIAVMGDSDHEAGIGSHRAFEPFEEHEDRPAVICFTSGTTGAPKAALFRVRNLRSISRIDLGEEAESIWDGGSPMLASTQFAHVGMSTKFPWYLRLGSTLHVMERWRASDALRLVQEHRMPTVGAIAPQLALMLRSLESEVFDVGSVRLVVAGGAASPPALIRRVRDVFDAGYSVRYSSTESGGVGLATDPTSDDETEWSTVGRPRPGVEVRITDEDDQEVDPGSIGELQLRSGAVMDRYWNDPVATEAALSADRWLRTGDLARLDEQGRVVLVGRAGDMYIRGGYNVFPSEVESVLVELPQVRDIVIVPAPDEVMGEIGVALVATDGQPGPTLDALREFGARQLARYKLPEDLIEVDQIPLTAAQKLDRKAAKALLEGMSQLRRSDADG